MIDVKVTTLGGPELVQTFQRADGLTRSEVQQELDEIGKDVVLGARGAVPRRTGRTMRRIVYRHGRETRRGFQAAGDDRLVLTVLPGEPTAHLIERGVDAVVTKKSRRSRGGDVRQVGFNPATGRTSRRIVARGVAFVKPYRLRIPARPYFTPAVEAVSAGVPERLQAAVERGAAKAQGGG